MQTHGPALRCISPPQKQAAGRMPLQSGLKGRVWVRFGYFLYRSLRGMGFQEKLLYKKIKNLFFTLHGRQILKWFKLLFY
ncbi:hypothetical protein CHU92_06470 [Flavobacterium cyanobacteriorum]|uniref:Uncharacterized protein n=1 Tax=Flavobacterium cyanobacteriorum TaxID=2022802 RepID=A0A255Z9A9_9FLAO|nr:hypothetical protein CHU92_06470 [Flavobacterium cyanobacteriorum]